MPACCLLPVLRLLVSATQSLGRTRSGLDAGRMTRGGSLRHWGLVPMSCKAPQRKPRDRHRNFAFSPPSPFIKHACFGVLVVVPHVQVSMGPRAPSPCMYNAMGASSYEIRWQLAATQTAARPFRPQQIRSSPDETAASEHARRREPPPYQIMGLPSYNTCSKRKLIRIQPRRQCRPLICPACRATWCVYRHTASTIG